MKIWDLRATVRVGLLLVLSFGQAVAVAGPFDVIFGNGFEAGAPPEESTAFSQSVTFLYSGPNPVQTGVDPSQLEPRRLAVLRGRVADQNGSPLPDVAISVLGRPQFGATRSQSDGTFAMVVNGDLRLIVEYRAPGYLPAQRNISPRWQDYEWLPDVALVPLDTAATPIALAAANPQVARGSVVSGLRGTRRPTLMIPAGTGATAMAPNGTPVNTATLTLRATEYTVGANGPDRMPGDLPAASGYTHAIELSADEVGPEGWVEFDSPIYYYVENYLGFPVGGAVPTGYYDRGEGEWVASEDGRIIEVVAVAGGTASVDVDGDGVADAGAPLDELGIDSAELDQLGNLYAAGTTLWRVPIPHLTPWDCNWPYGPPEGAGSPPGDGPGGDDGRNGLKESCEKSGSIVSCETQQLAEAVPLTGTNLNLVYSTSRVPGYQPHNQITVPVTGATLPDEVPLRADVTVEIAGRQEQFTYDSLTPDLAQTFTWDGLDAFGRPVAGGQSGRVSVTYAYGLQYYDTQSAFDRSFGQLGGGVALGGARGDTEVGVQREWPFIVGTNDAREQGLGGWTVDVVHRYDLVTRQLVRGDGRTVAARAIGPQLLSEERSPYLALTPDGRLLVADDRHIYEVQADGTREIIAGDNVGGAGDGNPARDVLMRPQALTVGPDGTIYFADSAGDDRIRTIGTDGIVRAFAGRVNEGTGYDGDGGPATQALLSGGPLGVALGPDGSVYIGDSRNNAIRRVDPDGIITTFAGGNGFGSSGDGGPAGEAQIRWPDSVAVDREGNVYFNDRSGVGFVRRVRPDGIIERFAGNNLITFQVDGVPATESKVSPSQVFAGPDGSVYITGGSGGVSSGATSQVFDVVRRVGPDGVITLFAGTYDERGRGDLTGAGNSMPLNNPTGIAVAPDNTVYIGEGSRGRIIQIPSGLSQQVLSGDVLQIASDDGREIYEFDRTGIHGRTLDAVTRRTLWRFDYDGSGRLSAVTDRFGAVTQFNRDSSGVTVVSPGGLETRLATGSSGYLDAVTDPLGNAYAMSYGSGGLLETFTDRRGNSSFMSYDALGRLLTDANRAGNGATLDRADNEDGYEVTYTDPNGHADIYGAEFADGGEATRTHTDAHGATTASIQSANGTITNAFADGSTMTLTQGSDPQLGASDEFAESIVITLPSGLQQITANQRTAVPLDPSNPSSLSVRTFSSDVNGAVTQLSFDESTRTMTRTDAEGRISTFSFNVAGLLTSVDEAAAFAPVTYTYDGSGRRTQRTHGSTRETLAYEANGWLRSRTNALGEAIVYGYDDGLRLTSIQLPSGRTVGADYDANGNPTSITLPGGQEHRFTYSATDGMTSYLPPGEPQGFTMARRDDGTLLSHTFPSGRSIAYDFSPTGRREGRSYDEASVDLSFVGNTGRIGQGVWTPVSGPSQTLALTYDGPLITTETWSGDAVGSYAYAWNDDMRLSGITLNADAQRAVTYDASGFLTQHEPFTYERNGPAGHVSRITDGIGAVDFTYDNQARLQTRVVSVGGTEVGRLTVTYDAAGRVTRTDVTVDGTLRTRTYSYDPDGQLTGVGDGTGPVESYEYDDNGNRTLRQSGALSQTAAYDARDRLQTQGGVSYTVNVDGMLASRGADSYGYSARSELLSATVAGTTVSYVYDARQRRATRTVGGDKWQFLYGDVHSPMRLTASQDPGGQWTEYFYDQGGQLFALQRGADMYYVVADQVGSPVAVVSDSGVVVKQIARDAWGVVSSDSNVGFELLIGFAGGIVDPTTGLVGMGFRDYDPVTGRFTTLDPIRFASREANLYAYGANDPVGNIDPTGWFTIGLTFYGGLGGGGSVSIGWGDVGFCFEGGVGAGGGLELDFFGTPENSVSVDVSAGGTLWGVGPEAGWGYKVVKCPDGGFALVDNTKGGITIPNGFAGVDSSGEPIAKVTDSGVDSGLSAKAAVQSCFIWEL